jgi:cell fate regulator YaaT (PSP1 superfamily)
MVAVEENYAALLAYENDQYAEIKKVLPKVGTQVMTSHGKGVIIGLNVLTESAVVELQSQLTVEMKADEVKEIPQSKEPGKSPGRTRKKR